MKALVSVIIPAYNVEKFLPKCVESVLSQTYRNLDIIIVDDGATDKTGEIADLYAEKHENIRCIHKKNGGLSDARNEGLKYARGEYVVFFDSDDWVESTAIEDNLRCLIQNDVQVVVWGYYADFVDKTETVTKSLQVTCSNMLCQRFENPEMLLGDHVLGLVGYAWNKIYCTELLREGNFTFPKGLSLVEDIVFNVPVFLAADKVYFNGNPYTHYIQRGRETLGSRYYDNFLELKLLACEKRKELLIGFGIEKEKSDAILWESYFYGYVSSIRMINRKNDLDEKEKIRLVKVLMERWCSSPESKKISTTSMKTVVLYFLFRFRFFRIIVRVIK